MSPKGAITFGAGMSFSGTASYFMQIDATLSITSNGVTVPFGFFLKGTITLADALSTTSSIVIYGAFNGSGFNVTANNIGLLSTASLTMGAGTWTLTGYQLASGSAGAIWDCDAAATITPDASTIKLTNASSNAKMFAGAGKTYNDIWLSGAGTGDFQFTGSNTFNDFKCDTPPHAIKFTAGTTTTVTTFTVSGTSGNLITIGSLTASSHTLTKAGGGVIDCDYLSISRSTGTPALTWYAGLHSTSGGNTSGWSFYTSTTTFNTGLFSNSGP